MERIRLDQHALQIQFAKQLPQHRSLMVFAGGVAGLADRHPKGSRVEHHLGNERRASTGGGLNRAPQCLAITDQLLKIRCAIRDLSDRPLTDGGAQRRHDHVQEEVAERGIRWRSP